MQILPSHAIFFNKSDGLIAFVGEEKRGCGVSRLTEL
jgi:hypothetical protein